MEAFCKVGISVTDMQCTDDICICAHIEVKIQVLVNLFSGAHKRVGLAWTWEFYPLEYSPGWPVTKSFHWLRNSRVSWSELNLHPEFLTAYTWSTVDAGKFNSVFLSLFPIKSWCCEIYPVSVKKKTCFRLPVLHIVKGAKTFKIHESCFFTLGSKWSLTFWVTHFPSLSLWFQALHPTGTSWLAWYITSCLPCLPFSLQNISFVGPFW